MIPLGLPVIIFGGILGGVVTPTEAAVLAVVYAFIVGVFVYREIEWKDLPGIFITSAVVTATVCFLLGTAAVVAWILAVEQIPQTAAEGDARRCPGGNIVFLVLTAVLFILLGAVLEGLPAVVILLPTFMPVVQRLGIDVDPLHHGGGGRHRHRALPAARSASASSSPAASRGCRVDRATRAMMPYVYMMCAGAARRDPGAVGHAHPSAPAQARLALYSPHTGALPRDGAARGG